MKFNFFLSAFIFFTFVFAGCNQGEESLDAGRKNSAVQPRNPEGEMAAGAQLKPVSGEAELALLLRSLDEIAELERAGSWFQGMGISESGIRENMGDYAGAVAAAFKEMSRAYGAGVLQKNELEQGLLNLLAEVSDDTVAAAANAILAFTKEQWNDAANGLRSLFNELDEPDGFARWMILVCELEKSKTVSAPENRRVSEAYKSIRARYAQFPEYWYRGAAAFSGVIAADFAENCINLSPQGPFAEECRSILAAYAGLNAEDGSSMKTVKEIETVISQSVDSGNPEFLNALFPLISLPDNPYTVFAVGTLRSLTGVPGFREYFSGRAASAGGRLAERLSYISLG